MKKRGEEYLEQEEKKRENKRELMLFGENLSYSLV
jgi:hypothetical protein